MSGPEVVISEQGEVKGIVVGDRVTVRGKIFGGIRGKVVDLKSSAHVIGDIHHTSLAIEKGAEVTGCCKVSHASSRTVGKKNADRP